MRRPSKLQQAIDAAVAPLKQENTLLHFALQQAMSWPPQWEAVHSVRPARLPEWVYTFHLTRAASPCGGIVIIEALCTGSPDSLTPTQAPSYSVHYLDDLASSTELHRQFPEMPEVWAAVNMLRIRRDALCGWPKPAMASEIAQAIRILDAMPSPAVETDSQS